MHAFPSGALRSPLCRGAVFLLLTAVCGCAASPPHAARRMPRAETVHEPAIAEQGPLVVPAEDRDAAWRAVTNVVDDHFEIEHEAHGELIGDSLLTANRMNQHEGSEPSVRHRGFVALAPSPEGFQLEVNVYREVAESNLPMPLSAQIESDTTEGIPPVPWIGEGHTPIWVPAGRNAALEEELLAEVRARLDGTEEPPWTEPLVESPPPGRLRVVFRRTRYQVWEDQKNFYSWESIKKLAIGFGIAAVIANTQADREFHEVYQDDIRSSGTDSFSNMTKKFGEGSMTIPIYAGAAIAGDLLFYEQIPLVGEWGNRSLRTTGVGFPLMLLMQRVTGAERPENDSSSKWTPWKNDHGVSGHAFMGAIPFISAAKMTDQPLLKAGLYIGSTLTGWSRINSDSHFISQAALGWWMAYLAASAVDATNLDTPDFTLSPVIIGDGVGMGIELRR